MSNSAQLQFFSDVDSSRNYSQISKNLNRLYKNKCFDSFIETLKRPKQTSMVNEYYSSLMKLKPNHRHKRELIFSTELVEGILRKVEMLELKKSSSRKRKHGVVKTSHDNSLERSKKRCMNKKEKDLSTLGKYHPNYGSIYPNQPSVQFSLFTGRNDKMRIDATKTGLQSETELNEQDAQSNHSLRFSKYTWRKENKKIDEQALSGDKYCQTEQSTRKREVKGIDYGKMKSVNHDFLNLNNKREQSPALGIYNPQFNCISKNVPSVLFQIEREKLHNKKYLLKKLWNNYRVCNEYQLVNLPFVQSHPIYSKNRK